MQTQQFLLSASSAAVLPIIYIYIHVSIYVNANTTVSAVIQFRCRATHHVHIYTCMNICKYKHNSFCCQLVPLPCCASSACCAAWEEEGLSESAAPVICNPISVHSQCIRIYYVHVCIYICTHALTHIQTHLLAPTLQISGCGIAR